LFVCLFVCFLFVLKTKLYLCFFFLVCLEVFDSSIPNTFTKCCGHTFHLDCVSKLNTQNCPVCRFQHDSFSGHLTECMQCVSLNTATTSSSSSAYINIFRSSLICYLFYYYASIHPLKFPHVYIVTIQL